MKPSTEEPSFLLDRGLRHLVAAFGGRTEFGPSFERPDEALAEDYSQERRRLRREAAARRDFERAWKTY